MLPILTSCQPGRTPLANPSDSGPADRPPSIQVCAIISPQVCDQPGQSGNPPLREAGSRLLVNPDIIHNKGGW